MATRDTSTDNRRNTPSFHDGRNVLSDVTRWHNVMRGKVHPYDYITGGVLDLIDDHLLQGDPKARFDSKELCEYLDHLLLQAQRLPCAPEILAPLERHKNTETEVAEFSGREDFLPDIVKIFQLGTASRLGMSSRIVVHGIGGIGKTQIAQEYVYSHPGSYSDVFPFQWNLPQVWHSNTQVDMTLEPASTANSSLRNSNKRRRANRLRKRRPSVSLSF